jgi:tRNA nucleotidyltransferase (CCA-adding enzyme)
MEYVEGDLILKLTLLINDLTNCNILNDLKFDKDTKKKVKEILQYKDFQIEPTKKGVKQLLNKLDEEMFFKLILLQKAKDIAHDSQDLSKEKYYYDLVAIAESVIEKGECFKLEDLAINGSDLMDIGVAKGKDIGNMLNYLLELVIDGKLQNKREDLIQAAYKEYIKCKKIDY